VSIFKQFIYFELSQNHSKRFMLYVEIQNPALFYLKSFWFKFEVLNQFPCFCFGKVENFGLGFQCPFEGKFKFCSQFFDSNFFTAAHKFVNRFPY
jgi:hypothetical protein